MDINKNISVRLKLDDIVETDYESKLIHFIQTLMDELTFKAKIFFWSEKLTSDQVNTFKATHAKFIDEYNVKFVIYGQTTCWYEIANDVDAEKAKNFKFRSIYSSTNKETIFNSVTAFYTFMKNATFITKQEGNNSNDNRNNRYKTNGSDGADVGKRPRNTDTRSTGTKYEQYDYTRVKKQEGKNKVTSNV